MFLVAATLGQMGLSKEISPTRIRLERVYSKATLLNPSLNAIIVYTQYRKPYGKSKAPFSLKIQPLRELPSLLKI